MIASVSSPRRRPLVALLAVGLGALALWGAYDFFSAPAPKAVRTSRTPVVVAPVGTVLFVDMIRGLGTARANESVTLTAKVMEKVRKVNFDDGLEVKRGDVLIEMTNAEEAALLDEAKANLIEADQQLERISGLVARGNASQARLDEQTRLRDAARARVAALEARLADRLIRAPFSGVLGFRQVSPGTLLQPGMAIATLDDITVIKLDFSLPELYLASLKPGLAIVAETVAYPGQKFHGTVSMVESRVDPATRAVTVRAEIANPDHRLRPGMLLTIDVIRSEKTARAVLEQALVPLQDKQFVYGVSDGVAQAIEVKIGQRRPGVVELLDGPEAGTPVVIEGMVRLHDGNAVQVQETRPGPSGEAPLR